MKGVKLLRQKRDEQIWGTQGQPLEEEQCDPGENKREIRIMNYLIRDSEDLVCLLGTLGNYQILGIDMVQSQAIV